MWSDGNKQTKVTLDMTKIETLQSYMSGHTISQGLQLWRSSLRGFIVAERQAGNVRPYRRQTDLEIKYLNCQPRASRCAWTRIFISTPSADLQVRSVNLAIAPWKKSIYADNNDVLTNALLWILEHIISGWNSQLTWCIVPRWIIDWTRIYQLTAQRLFKQPR